MDTEHFRRDVARLVINTRKSAELTHHDISFLNDAEVVALWYSTMLQTGGGGIFVHMALLDSAMHILEATRSDLPSMPELNDADRK